MKILSPRNKLFIFFALVLAITVITISAYAIDDQPVSSFDMTNPHAISGYYLKDTGGPAVGIPVEVHIIVCVGVVPPCVNYSCTSNVSIDTLDNGGYEYAFSTDYNEFYFDAYPTLECDTAIGSGDRVWTTANGTSVYCIDGISTETLISAGQTTFVENVTLVNCSEPWSPNVTLIWPPDGYDTKNGTVPFTYNVTDDSEVDNCSLIFNGSIIQTNHTIEVNQTLNITPPKLKNGKYNWSINCTDEWGNEGASESRILNVSKIGRIQIHYTNPPNNSKVDQYSFFFLTAELNCIDGMCGTINSTTFVLSSPNPTMMLPITPALPFYTISDNPLEADDFSCMTFMHEDDVCTIAWDVNASGNIYNNSQFHAWANSTQYAKVHNVSPPINLTIWDLREPIVVLVNADPSTIAQKNWTNITANITDNTVVDTALVNITAPDGSWYVYPMIPTGGDVWYYVYNTTLYTLPGLYNATVIANDTFGNVNDTEWATFTVEDKTAPEWSNNKTSPDSGSEYAPGKDYQFNLTWTDNIQVDDVIIEHNLTGSIQNITVTDRVGDEYYYDFSDLPAGEYYWKEYANDTSNNFNATPVWVYIVEKADPVPLMNLSLNGNQTNLTQVYGTNTVADSLKSFTEGSLDLYRNGTLIDSGQTPSDTTLLPVGYYNYTLIYEETQNYTYGDKTLMANIVPAIPILTLDVTGGWNQTYPAATTVNCTADTNQVDPKLYIDGIEIINPYSIQHAADNYNYTCNVTTTQNYTSAQVSNELIINKNISSCSLLFAPSPPQIYPQSVKANCTCTNPEEDEYMTRDSVDVTTENNIFVPLPAGFLNYNCSVPETQNYTYAQAIGLYTLQKNITAINLTINGQDSNVTVVWNSTVNYNVSLLPIDDIAGLYDNNLLLTNSLTPFNFSKYYRHIGTHEITANYTGNQNYTNSTDTHYLHVVDIVPPNVTLHEPEDGYWNDSTRFVNVTFNCSTYDDYNLSTVSLYLTDRNNNSFSPAIIENIEGTYNLSNWTIELHAGDYTWNCFVNDTSGNEGWGINRSFDLNFSIPLIGVVLVKNIWYEEDDNDTIVYRIDNTIHNYAEINMTNVTIFDKDLGYNKTINLTINETFTYTLNITINKSMNASIFLFSYGNAIHNNTKYYSNRPRILIPQIPEEALVPDCPACPSCGGGGTCPTCPTPECPDIECPALPPLVELCQSCPKEACPSLDCDKCEKKKVSEKIDVVDVISCSEEFLIEEQELEIEDLRDLVDIPEGYELVTQPFRATCSGGESFKTNILSGGNYEDVTVMKCTGGACESDTAIYRRTICGDENNETFKMIDEYNYSSDLAPFTFKQVNLTGDERIIRTGEYKVEIGVDINITLSQITTRILDPENENIKIVGSILNLSYAGEGVEQANVTMPYVLIPGIQEDGIAIYAFVDRDGQRGWKYVGGVVDKEKKVITATIDLAAYAHNGDVILVPMTLYCKDCEGSEFNNHHTPTSDTRRAVVLVHGLWSSNDVWDKLINDFKLSNQPFQVWTYSYDETKTLDETAQDFIDSLEANAYRYDSVYMVGYSLGGYVVQAGLDKAYKENIQESGSYLFLQSVEKVVLLGTPSDGTPMIDHMDSWVSELINTESTTMLPMNPQVRDVLRQGVDYEPIYGIDYYSIAGTKPYDFMEKLGFTETVFDGEVNDGFVSVSSAQKLGMSTLDEECVNFWARPVEHTKLNDDPLVYELLGQIVTLDLAEELLASGIDVPLIGFSNNIEVTIEDCSPDDLYFLVGKKIDRLEKTIYCACGNGVCDGLENSQTCPEDCVSKEQVIEERPVTLAYLIAFISLLLLLLFILLLFLYYKKKHLVLYQGDKFKIKADFVSPIPIASMRFVIAAPPGIHVEPKELKDIPANRKVRVITKGQVDWDMPPNRYKAFSKAILTTKEELAKPFHLRILEREKEPKAPEKLPKDIWLHNRRIALRHIRRTIVELKITAIQIKQDVMRRRIEARSKLHRIGKQKQKLEYKKKRIILEIHRRTQLRKIKHQAKDTEKMIGKLGKKQKSAEKELVKTKDKKGKVQIRHVQKKVRELEHQRDYLKHRDEIIREQYQKRIDSLRNSELKRQGVKVYLSVWRKKR